MAGRFPLLLDEHVPRSLAEALLRRGWTVVRVVDLKTELGQGADTSVGLSLTLGWTVDSVCFT